MSAAPDGLERRYRRLLAVYPWQHRRTYEEEMVTVLLSEADPGRNRPTLAETTDLLVAGVGARLQGTAGGLRDSAWRQAAYAVAFFGAILVLAASLRPLVNEGAADLILGDDGFGTAMMSLVRPALWGLAVAALALHRRRFAAPCAAVLTVLAAVAEIARVAGWYADSPTRMLQGFWLVTAATVIAVAALWILRGVALPRPRGTRLVVAAVVLILGAGVADIAQRWWHPDVFSFTITMNDVFMVRIAAPLVLAAAVLMIVVGVRLPAAVRRRVAVFALPVAVIAVMVPYGFAGFMYSSQQFDSPIPVNPLQWTLLIGVPVLSFVVAALALHRRERQLRWIALGRVADGAVPAESGSQPFR
jgi:hypothetical protein